MSCHNNFRFGYFNQESCQTYPDPDIEEPADNIPTEGRSGFAKTPNICSRDRGSGEVMLEERDLHLFTPKVEKKINPLDSVEDEVVTLEDRSTGTESIIDGIMSQVKKYMKEKEELAEILGLEVKEETEENQISIIDAIKDELKQTD